MIFLVQVRDAAQALLLAELGRLGTKGRKALVDAWAQFLPLYSNNELLATSQSNPTTVGQVNTTFITVQVDAQGIDKLKVFVSGQTI